LCTRCGTTLARNSGWGADAPLAFIATSLVFAVPAVLLPFVTIDKLGNGRISFVLTGAWTFWQDGMRTLAAWVLFCGALAPVLLLLALAALLTERGSFSPGATGFLRRAARALQHWAMPEVHVLAVVVAFFKLGSLVNVRPGPGLWCYAAMSVAMLLAWRGVTLEATPQPAAASRGKVRP
jgi:paraquat-inducible protein A